MPLYHRSSSPQPSSWSSNTCHISSAFLSRATSRSRPSAPSGPLRRSFRRTFAPSVWSPQSGWKAFSMSGPVRCLVHTENKTCYGREPWSSGNGRMLTSKRSWVKILGPVLVLLNVPHQLCRDPDIVDEEGERLRVERLQREAELFRLEQIFCLISHDHVYASFWFNLSLECEGEHNALNMVIWPRSPIFSGLRRN